MENPTDRGAWQATVHRVAESQTQLKQLSTHTGRKESELEFGHWNAHGDSDYGPEVRQKRDRGFITH